MYKGIIIDNVLKKRKLDEIRCTPITFEESTKMQWYYRISNVLVKLIRGYKYLFEGTVFA